MIGLAYWEAGVEVGFFCSSFFRFSLLRQTFGFLLLSLQHSKEAFNADQSESSNKRGTTALTACCSMRLKMTLSICVSVALAVVWFTRFLLAR